MEKTAGGDGGGDRVVSSPVMWVLQVSLAHCWNTDYSRNYSCQLLRRPAALPNLSPPPPQRTGG
uniref:Uncharacterized protein n=1 Tax=Oryza nivara TaxID=4536 RepID=A0A0E0FUP8_ORYNI